MAETGFIMTKKGPLSKIYNDAYPDGYEVQLYDIMVDSETTLSEIPEMVPPGSTAHLPDHSKEWELDFDGTWQEKT